MPEEELLDVVAAAERHRCSTQTIWRRIRQGVLPRARRTHKEKVSGRDGPPVIKTLIRVSDLNDAFEWTAHEQHVRRIRDAAPPLTDEQATAIRKVLMDHLRERDAMRRRRPGEPGSST
ncbi:MAG: hypothetical protein ACTHWM_08580 [Yaniella sp.]|uniref:hypothetical protein n=1 Tax=Micrococcales TaxID=85006 RepID=UPI002647FB51|nr:MULTISPECIES: hypothetical protein [Micrococcales]MDN5725734.1 hypothetical protein [Propionibacteriales bacterium]MDN6510533.1 hypothetical protein [Corynebacterium sp.]MDN5731561.1 hypothetical protein [Yaniella sp.]MDN5838067.1 hypothetical protein [Yaniella sp.]MDN6135290.1 hypothetical protein [Brevibacterium sp.]